MSSPPSHVVVDKFAFRQFPQSHEQPEPYSGAKLSLTCEEFERRCNEFIEANGGLAGLKPGYAPFCKHIFIPNSLEDGSARLTDSKVNTVPITQQNEHLLRTEYDARTEKVSPSPTSTHTLGQSPLT